MTQGTLIDVPAVTHPPGASDEFWTPKPLFDALNAEFRFTVDAASSHENAKLPRHWTPAENGLDQSWRHERVWCNPPYSEIYPWVKKAWRAVTAGRSDVAELVVMLLPAWTDRAWWSEFIEDNREGRGHLLLRCETRFLRGRVRFGFPGDPEGRSGESPTFGSVIVIWRPRA